MVRIKQNKSIDTIFLHFEEQCIKLRELCRVHKIGGLACFAGRVVGFYKTCVVIAKVIIIDELDGVEAELPKSTRDEPNIRAGQEFSCDCKRGAEKLQPDTISRVYMAIGANVKRTMAPCRFGW